LPLIHVAIRAAHAQVEVASQPQQRIRGLMYRTVLGADQGMLFVFPEDQSVSFWMRDTSIPLSIAYLGAVGRIVRIAEMRPFDTHPVPSVMPVRYALEMPEDWFTTHRIAPGDQANFAIPTDIIVR